MPFEQPSVSSSEAIAKLKERLSGFETEEGRLSGLSYQPKSPDEIIITTTPKAGNNVCFASIERHDELTRIPSFYA